MGSDFGEMSIVDFLSSQVGNLDQNGPRLFSLYLNGLFTFGLPMTFGLFVIWTILVYKDMRAIAIRTNMKFGLSPFGLFWTTRTFGLSPFGLP